jgi:hypothetical protein
MNRRFVTLADVGFEEAGSAYERVALAVARVDAQEDPRDVLTQIRDFLFDTFGVERKKQESPPLHRPN